MIIENTVWDVMGTIMSLVVVTVLAFALILRPEWIIQLQAKFYRKRYHGMTDEQIDKGFQLPWDRFLIGRKSEFVHLARDEPERFPSLARGIRIIGFIILFMTICTLTLFILAVVSGRG